MPAPDDEIPRSNTVGPIGQEAPKPPTQPFQSYMQGAQPNALLASTPPQVSPFDLAHGTLPPAGPTMTTLLAQAKQAHTVLGDMATQLNTPNLKLKQSSKALLKKKLGSANSHLRSAAAAMGAEVIPESATPAGANPIQKFLAMITDGQTQLQGAQDLIAGLKDKGENLSAADMLLIQIKLNKAQQELEYSSILLSKAMDDIKMLMNIQL
jgi:hypothetical protein